MPKVVLKAPETYFTSVWKSLHSSYIDKDERNIMFLIIHNKLPVQERLFRIGVKNDPYCPVCPSAEIADIEHWFCTCVRTKDAWEWLRQKLLLLEGRSGMLCSNSQLLSLIIPASTFKWEMIWLISSYVHYAWETVYVGNSCVQIDRLFGFLRFKFRQTIWTNGLNLSGLATILNW